MTAQPPGEPKRRIRTLADRIAAAKARVQQEPVDFSAVPPSQWEIHDRLENWGRWCHGRPGFDRDVAAPMFRLFKSDEWEDRERRVYGSDTTPQSVDKMDAAEIHKGVAMLPEKNRRALQWLYVRGGRNPKGAAWEMGLSVHGLAEKVAHGRLMLINRRV